MKNRFPCLALLGFSLLSYTVAPAAIDTSVVGSDALWVFTADLNALRASVVGKEAIAAADQMKLINGDLRLGLDMQKLAATVGSVTAYGSNFAMDPSAVDGTLVVRGTADLRKISEAALIQATLTTPEKVSELKGQPFPVYVMSSPSAEKNAPAVEVLIGFPTENVVLISKSKAQLMKARDVLRGSAPSLAKNAKSPLNPLLQNAGTSFLFAASVVPTDKIFADAAPQARILQMANAGSISIGETGPNTFAHLQLLASSDDSADKLVKILQGMTAMMSLAETNDKQLAEFLSSANVARTDQAVTLHLSYASERLVQMVKSLQEGHQRPVAQRVTNGKQLGEWVASEVPVGTDGFASKSVDNVRLVNGSVITVSARLAGGNHPRLDRIEVAPASGAPLVFRAEYMRLNGFTIDAKPSTTGGKMAIARTPNSTARIQFPGAEGTYTIKVAYVADAGDATSFSLGARDPETVGAATKNP